MPIPPLRPRSQATFYKTGDQMPHKKKKRAKGWVRRYWLPVLIILFLIGGIGAIGAFAYYSKDLPDPEKINERSVAQSTRIYARDETTILYEVHGDVRRTVIPLTEIPEYAMHATISVEDKDFYKHKGVSIRGIIRAIFTDITTGSSQGGSTITQQLIKNTVLTTEKSINRKIKELVLAYQMESKFTKDQILQLYFNEIPYGSNVYGIEAATQYYFGKNAQNLTLDEAALLAALPQRPTYYSPYGDHTDILVGRQQYVLNLMAEQGYLTRDEVDTAKQVDVLAKITPPKENITAPHFVFYVREYLTEKYGESVVERGGLKVVTTLEPTLQQYAESAVEEYGQYNQDRYKASNASLVAVNPITGQILAMVGSRDYFNSDIDGSVNVALRTRNPGSSFKPFVYTAAFTKGYTPDTILFDLTTNFGPQGDGTSYTPKNFDGGERGPVTIRKALQGSLNIPAVKALYLAGIPDVVELAKKSGYTTISKPEDYGLALALGGAGVKLLDHVAAFGVFAQQGTYRQPQAVIKVLDNKGKILEQYKVQEHEVLDKNIANMTANILTDNDARSYIFGSGSKLYIPGRQVGAKTGTTNDNRDAWTVGFTPSFVAGVWSGNNDNSQMSGSAGGSTVAAPIWNSFMRKALQGTPQERFPEYQKPGTDKPILNNDLEGESTIYVDSVTGLAIPTSCLGDYPEQFKQKSSYREVHSILYYVDKNNPQGDQPANPTSDPQFSRWEEPVRRWALEQGYTSTKPKEGSCDIRSKDAQPKVSLVSPTKSDTITSFSPTFKATATGTYGISSIQFFINDILVGTIKNSKTSVVVDLSSIANGFQTVRVVATDIYKNTATVSATVNILIPGNTVLDLSPQTNTSTGE
ncbi:MAG: penicillin-binding protein [Candidatus Kerfeldbacteria bacterium CG08_land_8_20_14_0_20_42_7]|uniref:Penicillin-binding protein n=1 Tax=Candidatus Kerfeldbacteria bacterium CG08_land_8_20_14_0_20_42_7 TaxID=2014245 RepID=A0A2H0YW35_9BACT|nr:MAG: penicillin-binding protein [Candidatus Kerfeldbacteria bacterium CG08_land_8_20_14_0_20_42_7]